MSQNGPPTSESMVTLQMQVHSTIQKIKGEVYLCPKEAAAYSLLTLATAATAASAARPVLNTIMPNQVADHVVALVLPPLRPARRRQDPLGEDSGQRCKLVPPPPPPRGCGMRDNTRNEVV